MTNHALESDADHSDALAVRGDIAIVEDSQNSYHSLVAASHFTMSGLFVKRAIDILLAVVGIVIAIPFAMIVAVAVKCSSPGPILFVQDRVGRNAEVFKILKFRTMQIGTHRSVVENAEANAHYVANDFKLPPDDPRITSVGRVLRKTSIDELPQLINVLRGEMSIVGIRPIESAQLGLRSLADQEVYKILRPGLTGIWQINGRSIMDPADRVTLDNRYVDQWSIWGDVKIMLRTPIAILKLHHTH